MNSKSKIFENLFVKKTPRKAVTFVKASADCVGRFK